MSGVDARDFYLRKAAILGAYATIEKALIPDLLLKIVGSALGA